LRPRPVARPRCTNGSRRSSRERLPLPPGGWLDERDCVATACLPGVRSIAQDLAVVASRACARGIADSNPPARGKTGFATEALTRRLHTDATLVAVMRVAACMFAVIGVLAVPTAGSGRALPTCPCRPVLDFHPAWAPNDDAVAYESTEAPPAVFSFSDRSTAPISVPADATFLVLSPDFALVAGVVYGRRSALVVFKRDGSDVRVIDDELLGAPVWSPDNARLAYLKREADSNALYTIRADGTDRQRVAAVVQSDALAWSPDSSHIAFAQGGGVVVARADGLDERRIQLSAGSRMACHRGRSMGVGSLRFPATACGQRSPSLPSMGTGRWRSSP
jgi:hypothetical protein